MLFDYLLADGSGDQFFMNLANNSQIPAPFQVEKQADPQQNISEIFNQSKQNEELKKASPQKNIIVPHNEKETFKTISPSNFSYLYLNSFFFFAVIF